MARMGVVKRVREHRLRKWTSRALWADYQGLGIHARWLKRKSFLASSF